MNRKLLTLLLLLLPVLLMGTSILVRKSAPRQDSPKKIVVEPVERPAKVAPRNARPVDVATTATPPPRPVDDFADDIRRLPMVEHTDSLEALKP